jgi:hypothetical protein
VWLILIPFPRTERAILVAQFVRQLRRLTSTPCTGHLDTTIRREVARLDPWILRLVALKLRPRESARWIA